MEDREEAEAQEEGGAEVPAEVAVVLEEAGDVAQAAVEVGEVAQGAAQVEEGEAQAGSTWTGLGVLVTAAPFASAKEDNVPAFQAFNGVLALTRKTFTKIYLTMSGWNMESVAVIVAQVTREKDPWTADRKLRRTV